MESDATLVGAYRIAELHTVAQIDMYLTVVILPWYSETNDAVGFHQPFYQTYPFKLGVLIVNTLNGKQYFPHGLQILGFTGMLGLKLLKNQFRLHITTMLVFF